MTTTAPRRSTRTYTHDGREVYADTGRPVDEEFGTHVVFWIVDDAEVWAKAIEADGDAEPARWPKSRRYIGEQRKIQRYEDAAKILAAGVNRKIYSRYHRAIDAEACVADLYRSHPNPGVRYEVAPIVETSACTNCHQPTIYAGGQWWHCLGRHPIECAPTPEPDPEPEPELADGEFEINVGLGSMTCGYCNRTQSWPKAALGYVTLTGFHLLAVEKATNNLVVIAEGTALSGQTTGLPHHCRNIPAEVHQQYAPTTNLLREDEDD